MNFKKLKYLSNFWQSLKAELKLRWTKYATAGVEKFSASSNNIIVNIKDTKLYVPDITLSGKDNTKLSKFLCKRFER